MPDSFTGEALTCVRGERVVFTDLSFAVSAGEALVLRGPNGCGKSSLLRVMSGLTRPAEGKLCWNGEPTAEDRLAHCGRLRYVGHLNGLKPALTARENLRFAAALTESMDRVDHALEWLGLSILSGVPMRFLSSGERRRLALARLAATRASLWILDEPTVGLDDTSLAAFLELVKEHCNTGGIAVLATHGPLDLPPHHTLDMAKFAVARQARFENEAA
jgi:heme exporter protein A